MKVYGYIWNQIKSRNDERGSSPTRPTRAISWSYSCGKMNNTPTFSRRSSRGCRRGCRCRCRCRRRGIRALRSLLNLFKIRWSRQQIADPLAPYRSSDLDSRVQLLAPMLILTSPTLAWQVMRRACMSVCISICVSMSISQKPRVQTSPDFLRACFVCLMARSSCDRVVVISYAFYFRFLCPISV